MPVRVCDRVAYGGLLGWLVPETAFGSGTWGGWVLWCVGSHQGTHRNGVWA